MPCCGDDEDAQRGKGRQLVREPLLGLVLECECDYGNKMRVPCEGRLEGALGEKLRG
jgi:hypothetical protein